MTNYSFDRVRPPLMKDCRGDVYSVPNESLRETYGPAKWTINKKVKGTWSKQIQFELTRNIYWSMFIPPEHFAEDITKTVTIISGVSEIQKHTMENELEASASASGFGLSASVKASLKMTDETTHEWHKEQKEEREQTFKAGCTYCTWRLVDELLLKKTTLNKIKGKPVTKPIKLPPFLVKPPYNIIQGPVISNSEMSCFISTYQDKWEDTESSKVLAVMSEDFELQAAQGEPEIAPITLPTGKLALLDDRRR